MKPVGRPALIDFVPENGDCGKWPPTEFGIVIPILNGREPDFNGPIGKRCPVLGMLSGE
jgi:hypothetical protein